MALKGRWWNPQRPDDRLVAFPVISLAVRVLLRPAARRCAIARLAGDDSGRHAGNGADGRAAISQHRSRLNVSAPLLHSIRLSVACSLTRRTPALRAQLEY
jgi:hypothetical protein